MKKYRFARSCLALALTAAVTLSSWAVPLFAARAEAAQDLRAMTKGDYPVDDTLKTWVPPNVFFLLDVGSPMTFTPLGTLPLDTDGKTTADHILEFEKATYGTGARPLSLNGIEQSLANYSRYGRDIDSSNNFIGDEYCYYSPYDGKDGRVDRPFFLTFKAGLLANWRRGEALPTASNLRTQMNTLRGQAPLATTYPYGTTAETSLAQAEQLLALVREYLNTGAPQPVPESLKHFLVPNDSRMYQMKLVLWRMLADNGRLLSRMRTAMGTTYFETTYGGNYIADFYKIPPYDAGYYNGSAKRTIAQGAANGYVLFPHGAGPGWCDSMIPNGSQPYANSQKAYYGVDRDLYLQANGYTLGSSRFWRLNRARMLTPFDFMYEVTDTGEYMAMNGLAEFQRWIDGIEDTTSTSATTQNNPEMFPDGKTPLSGALYGHVSLNGSSMLTQSDTDATAGLPSLSAARKLVRYTSNAENTTTYGTKGSIVLGATHAIPDGYDGYIRAGQAVGSVIDFFSPPSSFLSFLTTGATNNAGYFPVVGSCQRNWVVVFTAGNDSDGLTGAEAVRKLYEDTRVMNGRRWNTVTKRWESATYNMETGVRTLVVGFVDPDATDNESVKLRETLTDMAQWGDPIVESGGNLAANPNAKPYFANDPASLIASLKAVLTRINETKYASASPTVDPDPIAANDAILYYVPSYIATDYDQWEGYFDKYRVTTETTHNSGGEYVTTTVTQNLWEANKKLSGRSSPRNLYMHGAIPGSDATTAVSLSAANLTTYAGVPEKANDFYTWLRDGTDSGSLLGDMEHSSYVITEETADKTVFMQTNRGFLHAIDDDDGNERWAYVPPNAAPRLVGMKYDDNKWISGTHLTSIAMNLLDGPLSQRELEDGDTLLFGNLGYGGAGVYAMNISNPSAAPKLLWAVDNALYQNTADITNIHRWGALAKTMLPPDAYDYSDLGFTVAPTTVVRTESDGDVALLPGGIGYKLGSGGDTQGKVIYVLEPRTGRIIKQLNESAFEAPGSRKMGMVLSAIAYLRNSDGYTKEFYAADSQGNIMYCPTMESTNDWIAVGGAVSGWKLTSLFQIRASSANGETPLAVAKPVVAANASSAGGRWFFATTSEVMVPEDSGTGVNRSISNPEQYVVGVRQTSLTGNEDSNSSGMQQLNYEADEIDGYHTTTHKDVADIGASGFIGWKMMLRPTLDDAKRGMEYVTTAPFIFEGMLFFSTFTPKTTAGDNAEVCPELGDAKIYRMNPITGTGMWNDGKRGATIKNFKIAGMTAVNGRLNVAGAATDGEVTKDELSANISDITDIYDDGAGGRPGLGIDLGDVPNRIPAKTPFVHYWIESLGEL